MKYWVVYDVRKAAKEVETDNPLLLALAVLAGFIYYVIPTDPKGAEQYERSLRCQQRMWSCYMGHKEMLERALDPVYWLIAHKGLV